MQELADIIDDFVALEDDDSDAREIASQCDALDAFAESVSDAD